MSAGTPAHDCGHRCCTERSNPHHDHFLDADQCGGCMRQPTDVPMFADVAEVSVPEVDPEPLTVEPGARPERPVETQPPEGLLGVADIDGSHL